ncbi:FMN adenylyltransferase [Candidatus Syntrophocurvum alkaliphilum]|uniref:Riboflavin biosynthesis protein n=1 Tax=Candidatus Syntrophocurvum alkaliphilum TaxID=2293317 RepID=A0A6I6D9W2_9FIRM|nr:bifunctional riboflavin kinase/FAD synthetase [Candidatus Syntrophocurvum alkaliphilum]QGT99217.1 FMN adenylyltransferase [Candidatus Syntrophocurvum alkaliphilum]
MEVIKHIDEYKGIEPVYLALGNFDGVHLGHQKLLKSLVTKAKRNGYKPAAFIFEPHPNKVLTPDKAPRLLVTSERKAKLLKKLGIELLIYTPFTREIAKCSPYDFVENILVKKFKVKEVFIGFNYSFGYKGVGNSQLLSDLGKEFGFRVNVTLPVKIEDKVVSSSLIRKALENGDINLAIKMLGYLPVLEGQVIKGEQRGSQIGFPTANININPEVNLPANGVYAAKAVIENKRYNCVVNIGRKPTFHDDYPTSVEAHIIDFNQNLYDKFITLCFIDKIRNEKRFNGINELIAQIEKDRQKALELINV